MNNRIFSAYEKNQLLKYGISLDDARKHNDAPIEYITGFVEFCGNELFVSEDVLIPRVETEELVDIILSDLKDNNILNVVLADLGTGSGAIGLSVVSQLKNANAVLSDISVDALKIAQKNLEKIIPKDKQSRIELLKSNLFDSYEKSKLVQSPNFLGFDVIVANLPYVPNKKISSLDASVIKYEPKLALDGGNEGWEIIDTFLKTVKKWITPLGRVYLELDETHDNSLIEKSLLKTFDETEFVVDMFHDQFGRSRFARIECMI